MSTLSPSKLPVDRAEHAQSTRLLQIATAPGRKSLIVESARGGDGDGQAFRFHLSTLSAEAGIALKSLIGQPALLQPLSPAGRDEQPPFHGYITNVELAGTTAGLPRYDLTLEPWTAFLARLPNSRVFQNMTVFDILDCLFAPWRAKDSLAAAWRYDVNQRGVYPVRSLTKQHQESDLAFAERLMREERLCHYFEHDGDTSSPVLGSHTLVIASDDSGGFNTANGQIFTPTHCDA